MEKTILLSVKGSRLNPDGEDNSVELITKGRLFRNEESGVYNIEYEESEISGVEGIKTLISVQGSQVHWELSGVYNDKLIFEKGKKFINSYETPFGTFQMEIYPIKVDHKINDNEGEVDLKYNLGFGGRYTSSNSLTLKFSGI